MNKNQYGFSTGITISAILVLSIIGLSGWLLHSKNTASTKQQQNTQVINNDNETPTPGHAAEAIKAEPVTTALEIKEWGVKVIPAKQLPNLSYRIENDSSFERASLKFEDLSANCDGMYWFSRAKSGEDIDGYGTTPEKYTTINPDLVKKLGDHYYYFGHGQAGCGEEAMNAQRILLTGEDNTSYKIEALN